MIAWLLFTTMAATPRPESGAPAPRFLGSPVRNEYARHDPDGTTVLSNGRLLRPAGRHVPLPKWPHGLVLSPDGKSLFIACDGAGVLIRNWLSAPTERIAVNPRAGRPAGGQPNSGAAAFSPDGKTVYWSGGDPGDIMFVDTTSGELTGNVSLNGPLGARTFEDSFAIDLCVSDDGRFLYCADVANFRVAVVDTAERRMVGSVDVGRYPYALAREGSRVYVANIGMFEYSAIAPPDVPVPPDPRQLPRAGEGRDPRGLTFPAYGFPSKEARDGVQYEGRWVPGLGDPNDERAFSVWEIDARDPTAPRVARRWKTGLLVGQSSDAGPTMGGSAPNFVLIRKGALWVCNNNNDLVERYDLRTGRRVARVRLVPSPLVARLRGVNPMGMALSRDGKRLLVCEAGINSVCVLDSQTLRTLGRIPTAWFPYRVLESADGRHVATICFRGFGNGPNGGKAIPKSPYLGMRGALCVTTTPDGPTLRRMTTEVLRLNGLLARPTVAQQPAPAIVPSRTGVRSSAIKHVVFITKENHTYDTIFDRVPGARHDPSLLRWGLNQTVRGEGQPELRNVAVMTNHNALAREFAISDNFYMEPEASGVGHRWLIGVQPNNFCQMTYTLGWSFKANTTAPGRRASFGSNGSYQPEDYPEAGAMWEHLVRHRVPFRNYGESFEFAGVDEGPNTQPTGGRQVVNIPMSRAAFQNTCREFPIFNMNIPDQYRAAKFMEDFRKLYLTGKRKMPPFINIAICNDHGARPEPERGYPYMASWMADNDLALGRIVEFLSRTPYWKNMAIFVTQDDSGGEPDHVDAQRSVLLVISPWAKRGYVSHRHTTIPSLHRTLYQLLGLPPLNLFDALANDFADCFTAKPDFSPYRCRPVDPRIFDPARARIPGDPDYAEAARRTSIMRDDPDDEEELLRLGQ